jgi:hypothetical protein
MWENCDSTFCSNHLVTKDSYDVTVNLGHGGRFKSKGNSNNWNMPCRPWSMEENKGKWVDIVINTNFGSNDDGYVNVWINGEKRCEYQGVLQDYVPRFPGHNQTAISGESEYPGPSHRRGIFINKNKMTTKTHPTLIAYYDEFRVGKSRKEVDIRMIEDPNYEPPKDRCVIGFIYKNNRCTLDVSNKYDGQYTMYLYRSYPDRNDKNIINATIEIKDGLLKVSDDSYRWIHKKIDDPLESFRGKVDSKGNVDWSMEIDPWKKSQFLNKVIFEGNLDKDESITGKYDEGTGLRIELKKKD